MGNGMSSMVQTMRAVAEPILPDRFYFLTVFLHRVSTVIAVRKLGAN